MRKDVKRRKKKKEQQRKKGQGHVRVIQRSAGECCSVGPCLFKRHIECKAVIMGPRREGVVCHQTNSKWQMPFFKLFRNAFRPKYSRKKRIVSGT